MTTHDIVGKLWNLCNVPKNDGVTFPIQEFAHEQQ